jgi:hypothetical protein
MSLSLYLNPLRSCSTLKSVLLGKKQCKIVIFGNFETSTRCHSNRNAVIEAIVKSTFEPSLISIIIEAFFIVSYQSELVTGGVSMKTAILLNMLMK